MEKTLKKFFTEKIVLGICCPRCCKVFYYDQLGIGLYQWVPFVACYYCDVGILATAWNYHQFEIVAEYGTVLECSPTKLHEYRN